PPTAPPPRSPSPPSSAPGTPRASIPSSPAANSSPHKSELLRFGIFLAPFHAVGDNPTLGFERDVELIQWLDRLGYDEAWIGEHHSGGWETIASPEVFIAMLAERTRHILLGTGVVSLPYHHPLMVANRMVLLDHLTRGRVLFGVGPGALVSDALMLGIDPRRQRPMMDEALDVIVRLLTEPTPLTHVSDWFALHDATLQIRPYTQPHPSIAVASMESPSGPLAAGRHGAGLLSLGAAGGVRGPVDLKKQWAIAEDEAARHGKTMRREEWRLVVPVHLAESREEAVNDVRAGAAAYLLDYLEAANGRQAPVPGPRDRIVEQMVELGRWIVGTPDDLVAALHRFDEASGGFGGFLISAHEWASREKTLKSYELLARYVMPRFQGALGGIEDSYRHSCARSREMNAVRSEALETAHQKRDAAAAGH
ncbi:MAG: LLM class flavin-dependent oxidoreductase, partial [Chloroflexi bacterium]|nr:LLM class flavin-dependent oxidoreductase [Chloroflexota bacterium]